MDPGPSQSSSQSFLRKAKPVWDELAALLAKTKRVRLRGLSADELSRLDRLYRLSIIHLAQIRSRTDDQSLIHYLDRLVARAHSFIYVAPKRNVLKKVVRFYVRGFPQTVARTRRYHMVSLVLFLGGACAAFAAASTESLAAYALTIPGDMRLPGADRDQLETFLRGERDAPGPVKLMFASMLLTHNTKIGLMAFALGVLCGVPTVFLIVYNGALLGAFAAMHHQQGVAVELWAWLLPHGVTELTAVILCGGAGLMLGMAVLRPGYRTRPQSLIAAGKEALRLVLGVAPMFIVAGFVESYVRDSHLPTNVRFAFVLAFALFWAIYFGFGYYLERQENSKSG